MDYNKVKKARKKYKYAVFFEIPQFQDFDSTITNIVEWQMAYLRLQGFYVTTVLNIKDTLTKAKAHSVENFAVVKLNYLVDWENEDLIRIIKSTEETIKGDENFFCCDYSQRLYNNFTFDKNLNHTTLNKDLIYKKIQEYTVIQSDNYIERLACKINTYNTPAVLIPWEGEKTKKLIKKLENPIIEIYSDLPVEFEDRKISRINHWNIFDNTDGLKRYFELQKENSYFYLGSHFLQFKQFYFYNTEEIFQKIVNIYDLVISKNSKNKFGGVFPWGAQLEIKLPGIKDWQYLPWNLDRY